MAAKQRTDEIVEPVSAPVDQRSRRLSYVICDVFTRQPLCGNPLAVVDASQVTEELMQQIAREFNLSETVFLRPSVKHDARLRIFTPRRELPFAGHPVLGAAAIVGRAGGCRHVALETRVGVIEVDVDYQDEARSFAWMKQPLPRRASFPRTDAVLAALGLRASAHPIDSFDNGIPHVYVPVAGPEELAALTPDMAQLAVASPEAGVACFAPIGEDWKLRMFAPGHGVAEDPATGSAAGSLAAYLIEHGLVSVGSRLRIEQGAELGRPSELHVRTSGAAGKLTEVAVGGGVVCIGHGQLTLPRPTRGGTERR